MAVEEDARAEQTQDRHGEADLVHYEVVVLLAREHGHPYSGQKHSNIRAEGDEAAAEQCAREPRTDNLNIQIMTFLETSVGIEVRRVNLDAVTFRLECKREVDDELFGTSNAQIRMQNSYSWHSFINYKSG